MVKPAEGVPVRKSREFKLKNQLSKNVQVIHLRDFGFTPETLIFERVRGNWFAISAVLTPEEIKKLDDRKKAEEAAVKDVKKSMKTIKQKNDTITDKS